MGLRPGVGRTIPMRMPWCGLSGCGDLREVVFGVALSSRTCSLGPTVFSPWLVTVEMLPAK